MLDLERRGKKKKPPERKKEEKIPGKGEVEEEIAALLFLNSFDQGLGSRFPVRDFLGNSTLEFFGVAFFCGACVCKGRKEGFHPGSFFVVVVGYCHAEILKRGGRGITRLTTSPPPSFHFLICCFEERGKKIQGGETNLETLVGATLRGEKARVRLVSFFSFFYCFK